ncbi:MAG: DUF3549 family protein [Oceanospirillaceae bacterium]
MSSLTSLTALLQESGAQFRIYDMGRQIKKISSQQFALIEKGQQVYPRPYLHHAWLALLMWNPKHKQQNVVWFLKFPLDEQGYLVQAVRDDFINRLMLNINQMLAEKELAEAEDALKDNPFSFTPDQEKMAMFHAITARETQAGKSQYYLPCQQYFHAAVNADQWQALGLQGIAEIAVSIDEHKQPIIKNFDAYHNEPLIALCCALEHSSIDHNLATTIEHKLQTCLTGENQDIALCCALLRALHAAPNEAMKQNAIILLLNSNIADSAELLSTIAVKMSEQLLQPNTLLLYLEKLATSEAGQQGFSRILADLMFSDSLRRPILQAFRNPERSEQLTAAIGNMFGNKF